MAAFQPEENDMAKTRRPPRESAITNALGGLGSRIGKLFEYIEIAEEELARGGVKQPGDLAHLFPGPFLTMHPELYRAHARELVGRMKRREALGLGTRAEVMLAMIDASLRAPLTVEARAVYEHLFAELLPDDFARMELGTPAAERWPGQVAEDIAATQRRLDGCRATMKASA